MPQQQGRSINSFGTKTSGCAEVQSKGTWSKQGELIINRGSRAPTWPQEQLGAVQLPTAATASFAFSMEVRPEQAVLTDVELCVYE